MTYEMETHPERLVRDVHRRHHRVLLGRADLGRARREAEPDLRRDAGAERRRVPGEVRGAGERHPRAALA